MCLIVKLLANTRDKIQGSSVRATPEYSIILYFLLVLGRTKLRKTNSQSCTVHVAAQIGIEVSCNLPRVIFTRKRATVRDGNSDARRTHARTHADYKIEGERDGFFTCVEDTPRQCKLRRGNKK